LPGGPHKNSGAKKSKKEIKINVLLFVFKIPGLVFSSFLSFKFL